jgi:hypothetical protein
MARFRRLAKDFELLPKTVEGLHLAVFACIMLARYFAESAQHSLCAVRSRERVESLS